MKAYLEKEQWLYKERFVRCYMNQFLYFSEVTTSCIEGIYLVLKQWIRLSNIDIQELYQQTKKFQDLQVIEYTYKIGQSRDCLRSLNKEFFSRVNSIIYHYPLKIINNYLKEATSAILQAKKKGETLSLGDCKGNFTRVFGMPCKH